MNNITILIPTYNPDERLIEVVEGVIRLGFEDIIIVNDGSKPECAGILKQLESFKQCHILTHGVNCGKGRALKTGFNYFYVNFPESRGLVTVDGDGQHQPEDVLKVAKALEENPGKLIIGSRQWGKNIPFRSLFGNVLTKFVFKFLVGMRLSDTQSGLRGISRDFIAKLITLKGERYEFETNMLVASRIDSVKIVEVPIQTIYIDNNKTSHFNPLVDSMKIYFLLFRFMFSSMFSAFIDFLTFISVYSVTHSILTGICVARSTSGVVNFLINKKIVFKDRSKLLPTVLKFGSLLVPRGFVSYLLIERVIRYFDFKVIGAYILVEVSLFFASFAIQRDFIFYNEEQE